MDDIVVELNNPDTLRLVQDKRAESTGYLRQWILWLGVGSAGGAVSVISLAAKLPSPDYAFHIFVPSLWAFLVGVLAASSILLFASLRAEATGEHFAAAHNREELRVAVHGIPEIISAPRSIAERMNAPRDGLIQQLNTHHERAEKAWAWRERWDRVVTVLMVVAALAFVAGVSWPLFYITLGGSLQPTPSVAK